MVARKSFTDSSCPVAHAVDVVGDAWSLLIIRDAFDGASRFREFEASLGIAKNILSDRLKKLVEADVLEILDAADGSAYNQYALTEKGLDLFHVIVSLRQWGERHSETKKKKLSKLVERKTMQPVAKLRLRSADGHELNPDDVIVVKP